MLKFPSPISIPVALEGSSLTLHSKFNEREESDSVVSEVAKKTHNAAKVRAITLDLRMEKDCN